MTDKPAKKAKPKKEPPSVRKKKQATASKKAKAKKKFAEKLEAIDTKLEKSLTEMKGIEQKFKTPYNEDISIADLIPKFDPSTKLCPEVIIEIVDCILIGISKQQQIADYVGIHRHTLENWIDKGQKAEKSNDPYGQFVRIYNKALQIFHYKLKASAWKRIADNEKDTLKAIELLLNRAFPSERVSMASNQLDVSISSRELTRDEKEADMDKVRLLSLQIQNQFLVNADYDVDMEEDEND
jgi:hypothetical protein